MTGVKRDWKILALLLKNGFHIWLLREDLGLGDLGYDLFGRDGTGQLRVELDAA